nr:MurR/RpiR family transcriptional regulator [Thalassobacillus sp. CUG 92003]
MSGGFAMLTGIMQDLPKSEQKIATYIMNAPEKVITMTAKQLGEVSETSSAAVIRLCKSLNLSGFQELKMRIAGDLHKPDHKEYREIEENEPLDSIINKMTQNSIQIIRETEQVLRQEDVDKAIQALQKAKAIHFFGMGASGLVAADAQQKFLRAGRTAYYLTDPHLSFTTLSNATEQDVAFAMSYSGETNETIKFVELAKERGVMTISLTKYGANTISNQADISLTTSPTQEAITRSAATSSRLAQLHVMDILFMAFVSTQYEQVIRSLDRTKEIIDQINQ